MPSGDRQPTIRLSEPALHVGVKARPAMRRPFECSASSPQRNINKFRGVQNTTHAPATTLFAVPPTPLSSARCVSRRSATNRISGASDRLLVHAGSVIQSTGAALGRIARDHSEMQRHDALRHRLELCERQKRAILSDAANADAPGGRMITASDGQHSRRVTQCWGMRKTLSPCSAALMLAP